MVTMTATAPRSRNPTVILRRNSVFRALKALWQFLGSRGVNTSRIWEKIKDIVIKTVIA